MKNCLRIAINKQIITNDSLRGWRILYNENNNQYKKAMCVYFKTRL